MQPQIISIPSKKILGKKMRMSLLDDHTVELWQFLMPRRKEIRNKLSSDLFSVHVFDENLYFKDLAPETEFEKWAAVEISEYTEVPEGMETLEIPAGLYAVFNYKGAANAAASMFQYIFETWIPASDYEIDYRPHFALMGEKYKGNDPDSEEEIWVPVKRK